MIDFKAHQELGFSSATAAKINTGSLAVVDCAMVLFMGHWEWQGRIQTTAPLSMPIWVALTQIKLDDGTDNFFCTGRTSRLSESGARA